MKNKILAHLTAECPWRDTLHWYDTIDSTNTQAKKLAKEGAAHGTVLVAGSQTAGRGRMGRSFSSPTQMGLYLSVILRPNCPPNDLMHLTCAAAVAACKAVQTVCGIRPDIKWINDLVVDRKKLGGILTELSVDSKSGLVEYAVIGIGINCCQKNEDFPPELQDIATSLRMITCKTADPLLLAAALIESLCEMDRQLLSEKTLLMDFYRRHCITLGQEVVVLRADEVRYGTALALDETGSLLVRFTDGSQETVCSGEVSVRGMYGYV